MSEYIVDFGTSTYKSNDGLIFAPVEQLREKIVRCRDCEYYEDYTGCCTRRDNIAPMAVTPDGFCAWAERREQ